MTVSATEPEHVSHATFQAPSLQEVAGLFPNYDIYRLIACGGMGAVYHANQRSLDRDVAIKILPREFSQDPEFRVSFEAEAKAMAKLNHPNLIGVYDFGDVTGLLYIVMEYVPGSSLYSVSNGRIVHQDDALKMVIDVCRGLSHAHEFGILHRDIKPSNILMDANANPKIGDFGLASALGKQVEEGDQIFGTPGYTAPEVIEPPHTFDHRADIFSVGIMLHEMLTGITPNGVDPLAELPAATNPKLRSIIQKAIHPNPEARYASTDELVADLEKIAAFKKTSLITGSVSVRAPHRQGAIQKPVISSGSRGANPISRQGALQTSTASSASGGARSISRQGAIQVKAASSGSGVARPVMHHRSLKPHASSGPGAGSIVLILLLIAAIALIYYFVIKPSSEEPTTSGAQNVQKPTEPEGPKKPVPRKTVAQEGVKPIADVDAFFVRVEGAMKDHFKEDFNTYREELKIHAQNFEAQTRQSIKAMGYNPTSTAVADLASTMQKWSAQNYLMSEPLPASLVSISNVKNSFSSSLAEQAKVRSRFDKRFKSEQASYLRDLNKEIVSYGETKDYVAIKLVEKEIARLKSEPGYFEFLIGM